MDARRDCKYLEESKLSFGVNPDPCWSDLKVHFLASKHLMEIL